MNVVALIFFWIIFTAVADFLSYKIRLVPSFHISIALVAPLDRMAIVFSAAAEITP
jgi:hypothetical protein